MIKNLKIFETGNIYGNMNTAKQFYPEDYTQEDRKNAFLENRMKVGKANGFDGHKMYMADQIDKTGTYFEIDNDYVEANPNGWSDISQDILIITDKTPGVVIGHPVADCPVVMMTDKKQNVTAIAHCSANLVDKKMPMLIADALQSSHKTKDEDITTYISACAGLSWTYDKYPSWATNEEIWSDCISEDENGIFHINLKKAVLKELHERNIKTIIVNDIDTITNEKFFSNSASYKDKTKAGRNFAGAFYKEETLGNEYKKIIKKI